MAMNSPVPPSNRRRRDSGSDSSRSSKRLKQIAEDDYFAICPVALPKSGGDTSSSVDGVPKPFQPPSIVDSHDCGVCGKSFSSYHALGGHKTSHRIKTVVAAVTDIPAYNFTSCGPHTSGGFHECSTCGKGYATGQALGGHMRKHFVGGISFNAGRNFLDGGNGDQSSVVTSFSDGGSASYSGRDGGSDLNTPPHSPGLDLTLKL